LTYLETLAKIKARFIVKGSLRVTNSRVKLVSLAFLEKYDESKSQFKILLTLAPNFIEDGEALIKMYVKEALHFGKITEALARIGVVLHTKAE